MDLNNDDDLFERAIARMVERIRATLDADLTGFPNYADTETGEWTTTTDGFWTGGFWPGLLWLASAYTGDKTFLSAADDWTGRLEGRLEIDSVFRGFLFYFAGSVGFQLAGNTRAAELAVLTAKNLQRSFRDDIGVIPLGLQAEEAHTVGANEANIDGIAASLVMMWAANHTGDAQMKDVAIRHALRTAEYCVRDDGSVCQSASFDGRTGARLRNYTHKGYSESSTWTRAQAWAMLGYGYLAGMAPEQPKLLALAGHVCGWWTRNVPEDLVAYWDFDAPRDAATRRDTSGTAIAAAGCLRLAHAHDDRKAAQVYQRFARDTVKTLCRDYLTPTSGTDQRPAGILTQGCFDHTRALATDNELIWGDYFLFESLGVLSQRLRTDRIYT